MTLKFRQRLIALVTFLGGIYFFLEFVLPANFYGFQIGIYDEQILKGVSVVGTMAFALGIINILLVHGTRLLYQQKNWGNSLALLCGLVLMLFVQGGEFLKQQQNVGMWKPIADLAPYLEKLKGDYLNGIDISENCTLLSVRLREVGTRIREAPGGNDRNERMHRAEEALASNLKIATEKAEALRVFALQGSKSLVPRSDEEKSQLEELSAELTQAIKLTAGSASELLTQRFELTLLRKTSRLLYEGFFVPLGAAMFALLAFYIANAAYRSFRMKSIEASVMMFTAIIVILGQIPQGRMYISETLPDIRFWLLQNVNTPGNRAIYFGSAIAGFAMAVRMWLSLEKNPLEPDEPAGGKKE